jgi:hypothetical protein
MIKTVIKEVPVEVIKYVEKETTSTIDSYLTGNYTSITNIAYKNKRSSQKTPFAVYLNQFITPNAFEVLKFKRLNTKALDHYTQMRDLGSALSKLTTWVDESKLYDSGDYYYYPEETLTGQRKQCDCEDVSFTMASFNADISCVAYGFYNHPQTKQRFGHAFPVFVYDDNLYIVETTGDSVELVPFEDERYEPCFLITATKTYQVRSGVQFGNLASWD